MRYTWLPIALLALCLLPRALAQQQPVTALIVVEGLTWQSVERGEVGALYVLARHGTVSLVSVGRRRDAATHFALALQTSRRLAMSPEEAKQRFARQRWLTEDLTRADVHVTTHFEPPQKHLQALIAPRRPPDTPTAQVQIWWLGADITTASRNLEKALSALNPQRDRVIVVGLPKAGERLTPILVAGSVLSQGILTSATTNTRGLISDVDIAPTLLRWHGVPTKSGEHPFQVLSQESAFTTVQRLAQRSQWNAQALIPLGTLQVVGGLLALLGVLRAIRGQDASRRTRLLLSVAVGALLSLPAGTVLASHLPANTLWQYVSMVALSAVWLSLLAHWGVWEEPFRAYVRACALTVLAIIVDGVSGQGGIQHSVYSAYALGGIRFYGIGNEMMGVLVGTALVWGLYGMSALWRAVLWVATAIVLVMPAWGANLGGLLASAAGLGCAWETTKADGKELLPRCIRWLVLGIAAALGVMWVDSLSVSPTHIGEAWRRWQEEGAPAVIDTLLSKLALTKGVLLDPLAWGALAAIVLALWLTYRSGVLKLFGKGENVAWLACIVAAFMFNDSGFVPAMVITSIGVGAVLTRQLEEVYHGASA